MESTPGKPIKLSSAMFADSIRVGAFLEFMSQYKNPKTVHNKCKVFKSVIDFLQTRDKGDTKTAEWCQARWVTKKYGAQMKAAGDRLSSKQTVESLVAQGKFLPLPKLQKLSIEVWRKLLELSEQETRFTKKQFFQFQSKCYHCSLEKVVLPTCSSSCRIPCTGV